MLISTQVGWYRYDPGQVLVPAGNTATGSVNVMHDLPGGSVLIGAQYGFLITPTRPLPTARVELETNSSGLPLRREVQIRLRLNGEIHADQRQMPLRQYLLLA